MQEGFVLVDKYPEKADVSIDDFLNGNVTFWRFSRLLHQIYQGEEPLARRLTRKLMEYNRDESRERTARKVRNWMHDRNLPKNREKSLRYVLPCSSMNRGRRHCSGLPPRGGSIIVIPVN